MKHLFLCLLLAAPAALFAQQTSFPGLKAVLTEAEWKRAGLDRLSPDELGVIDAALIRHALSSQGQLQQALAKAQAEAQAAQAAQTLQAEQTAQAQAAAAQTREKKFFERFGLPVFDDIDWRSVAPLKAKVVAWESDNRFRLDNGQVWEGLERINYELVGHAIEIQARPGSQFVLFVDGKNTTVRVFRLR